MADLHRSPPSSAEEPVKLGQLYSSIGEVYQRRCLSMLQSYLDASEGADRAWSDSTRPLTPSQVWADAVTYWTDFTQRSLLFWDTLRQRGNNWLDHEAAGKPPLLAFEWDIIADARRFERPANYALARIAALPDVPTDPDKRPFLIIDPRAGHGPGIGGFKADSEVGVALRAGHPVYTVVFFPDPVPGQTLADVAHAEAEFLRLVGERHPTRGKPVIVGNCQGGWAAMLVGALDPGSVGPIVVNGAPMSYWAGNDAENPMRYAGGMLGGSWPALLASDLGGGHFDGAHLVDNFEYLNPANTYFGKSYNLFSKIDTEPERYLEFERWWGGYFLMNREEIKWIVDNLFVGNRLAAGGAEWAEGKTFDLRAIRSPIILFASLGDNITPPQQAFNWVADLYPTTRDLKANGQVIVGLMQESIGHLGIFVSAGVARREHAQIVDLLEYIEHLPPGLYGMQVEEERVAGTIRYDVALRELQVEQLQTLQAYARKDEVPFAAVEQVSALNAAAYEAFLHPVLSAWTQPEMASLARALHPLRARRWAISDLNPVLAPLRGWAALAKSHRVPRDEAGLSVAAERRLAAGMMAGWDFYRQFRDATVENLFYAIYGTMSVAAPGEPGASAISKETRRDTAALGTSAGNAGESGFTAAAVRAALLVARESRKERHLSSFKRIRELVGRDVGLLDRTAGEAGAIVRRQAALVDSEPDKALETLPHMLRTAKDRRRLIDVMDRLLAHLKLEPEQRALMERLKNLATPSPRTVTADIGATPPKRQQLGRNATPRADR